MDTNEEIAALHAELEAVKDRLSAARRRRAPEPIADLALQSQDGSTVHLSELFGKHDDLLVIHNMGRGCMYCTLWADGFNGVVDHLQDRSAFVVVSPDEPDVQREFAQSRGWTFPMASSVGTDFVDVLGFGSDDGGTWPGVSAFRRLADGSIVRTGRDAFGPGDDYSAPWRLFDLLSGGAGEWEPKYRYTDS